MSFKVRIESFEGPFDLLLYLVSRQKVDIGSVSVAEIADQFLAEIKHMEALDLDVASDFMLVAATLLEIKAESLLPCEREQLDEDIESLAPSEARDILVGRLLHYKQFKNAASALESREDAQRRLHGRYTGPDEEFLDLLPDYLKDVRLDDLCARAAKVLGRREIELLDSEHIAAKPIPVEVYIEALADRLEQKKKLKFSEFLPEKPTRAEIIVCFLAVLELCKRARIAVRQRKEFGDMELRWIETKPADAGDADGAADLSVADGISDVTVREETDEGDAADSALREEEREA